MKFKKQLMINRLTKEGRADAITPEVLAIMDNIDGCEAHESCWSRRVKGEPVLWVVGRDGVGIEVNEADCTI